MVKIVNNVDEVKDLEVGDNIKNSIYDYFSILDEYYDDPLEGGVFAILDDVKGLETIRHYRYYNLKCIEGLNSIEDLFKNDELSIDGKNIDDRIVDGYVETMLLAGNDFSIVIYVNEELI